MTGVRLTQALHRNAELFPERLATVSGQRRTDWRSTLDHVARLAAGFRKLGAQPGDRIAILAHNSDRYIVALYAALWAGCVPVPLNARWTAAEIQFALEDCTPRLLLHDPHFADIADACRHHGLTTVATEGTPDGKGISVTDLIANAAPCADASGADDDLAIIFYTGGTTGRSKGVMLSHNNLVGNFLAQQAVVQYPLETVFLHIAPMFHMADACCLVGITMLGGTHVAVPSFDPVAVIETIRDESVTATLIVPTIIAMLVHVSQQLDRPIPELRNILYGASPISEALLRQAMAVFPNARLAQGYGQTEASPIITVLEHEDHLAGNLRAAGRPPPCVDVRIVDDVMRDVPIGTVGEIVTRGPGVMLGYWHLPDLTEATIVDGWLRTGDAGYRDDRGYLYIVDRLKDMIVTGGENVYSSEVENALMKHPAVLQCAVIGVPDATWGEAVHAFVQVRDGATLSATDLLAHTKSLIASYKCPKTFTFQTEPLPMSGAGKILKTSLKELWTHSGPSGPPDTAELSG